MHFLSFIFIWFTDKSLFCWEINMNLLHYFGLLRLFFISRTKIKGQRCYFLASRQMSTFILYISSYMDTRVYVWHCCHDTNILHTCNSACFCLIRLLTVSSEAWISIIPWSDQFKWLRVCVFFFLNLLEVKISQNKCNTNAAMQQEKMEENRERQC